MGLCASTPPDARGASYGADAELHTEDNADDAASIPSLHRGHVSWCIARCAPTGVGAGRIAARQ